MDDFKKLDKIFNMKPFDVKKEIPKAPPLKKLTLAKLIRPFLVIGP